MRKGARAAFVVAAAVIATVLPGGAAFAAIPDNDDLDAAQAVAELPATLSGDVTEATDAPDDSQSTNQCWGLHHTVWYTFTPTEDVDVKMTLEERFNAAVMVFTGDRGELQAVSCFERGSGRLAAEAGRTYSILVGALWENPPGSFDLTLEQAPPPPNDAIKTARPIHELPYRQGQDAFGATREIDDPDCFNSGHSVWFTFTPEKTATLIASTIGSGYDTALGIYTGRASSLKEVACIDDTRRSDDVRRRFEAEAGTRYFIMVGSEKGIGGLDFSLQRALATRITAGREGQYHEVTGLARVSGTIRCNQQATVRISGILRQRHGDTVAVNDFAKVVKCSRKVTAWRIAVSAGSAAFTAGEAGLSLVAVAVAGKETARDRSARLVVLRGSNGTWGL